MTDHALFVGVGDGTGLEGRHVSEGLLESGLHGGREIIREGHAADVERQAELRVGVV
jgi:hypothetical protein